MLQLKIFEAGFSVDDFNTFTNSHIVDQIQIMDNGNVYVRYKTFSDLGLSTVEKISKIDSIIKGAESNILAYESDIDQHNTNINDLNQILSEKGYGENQKEYKDIQEKIQIERRAVLTSTSSMEDSKGQILSAKDKAQAIINETEDPE